MNWIYIRFGRWEPWDRSQWPLSILGNEVADRLVRTLQRWPACYPPGIDTTFNEGDANITYENNKAFLLNLYSDVLFATNHFEMEVPRRRWAELQLPARLEYAILLSNDFRRPPFRGGGGNICMMCRSNRVHNSQLPWINLSENSNTVNLDVRNSNDRGGQWIVTSLSLLPGISSSAPRYCHNHLFQIKRLFEILMASPT